MRALIGGAGKTWQLRDIDSLSHLGAIRIQVMAAGINHADLYALDGSYTAKSQQSGEFTAGMEVAGIVETSSPLAPHLRAGTRVMGITVAAFADYALCDPRLLVPIPDGLSFEEAATLPVGLTTEHDALVTRAGFTVGNSVLIVGGTGVDITLDHVGGDLFAALPAATAIGGTIVSIGRLAATHPGSAPAPAQRANMFGTIRQIGYVVRDIEASMRGFVDSGIGPWFYLKGLQSGSFTYRGEPSGMVMDVAVANSGDIQIELISPVNDEPSMDKDFLDADHEGMQHFACWNENYQDLYDRALAAGFTVGQKGEIGGATGGFAYLETEHHPGTVVEISDFGGTKKFVFDFIELAAANWDGTNPIQVIDPALLSGDPAVMDEMKAALGG
ncbi:VOC family protein [Nocardia sp. NBC_01377]|uniref:VOC family protein n=1 Tax=Nocardia sp. NBC_01377 TaxID=2903595 RepID=UPI00324FF3A2